MKLDAQALFAKLPHLLEEISQSASTGAYRGSPHLRPLLQSLAWLAADVMGDDLKPRQQRLAAVHLHAILEATRGLQEVYAPKEPKQ